MSVTGGFGQRARACVLRLLDEGLVHLVATDGHDPDRRPPVLSAARDAIASRCGAMVAERLVHGNAEGVLEECIASRCVEE